ncbi:MAG: hypothetical protein HZC49_12405 [Nitrospirae bacterium]|nr:hypothetical protein [Nitrospirota bacterium]
MTENKLSLLDKKIAQFCDSSRELLTDIHTRKKGAPKGAANQGRKIHKPISIPDPDIDLLDEEPLEL